MLRWAPRSTTLPSSRISPPARTTPRPRSRCWTEPRKRRHMPKFAFGIQGRVTMSKVGFIGLGIMGAPMAGHLQAGGHQLFALTHHQGPEALVAGRAQVCANGQEVAQNADIIITIVPDTPDDAKVLFATNRVSEGHAAGASC